MAIGSSTFTAAGGAVSDIFAGFGALSGAQLKAKGLDISAEGLRLKAKGDIAEAQNYDLAAVLARQNKDFTEVSTGIKLLQSDRALFGALGKTSADVAGAGFAASGSGLDILRDSASQGALTRGVLSAQGQITEAGYEEQAKSYETMSAAGRLAAAGEEDMATKTEGLAQDTIALGKQQATGDFISAAIKGVAAVASIGLAPVTGGASLLALPAIASAGPGIGGMSTG